MTKEIEQIKKTILFINHNSDLYGGANDDFLRLLRYFRKLNDKYYILGIFPEGPNVKNFANYCDEWYTYNLGFFPVTNHFLLHYYGYAKIYFTQKKQFSKILEGKKIDLCILNVVVMLWLVIWINSRNLKSLIFIREKIEPKIIRKYYYKLVSKLGNYFIAVSDSLENDFKKFTGKNNIRTLYSSVEKENNHLQYKSGFENELIKLKLNEVIYSDRPKFINIGTLCERKNQFMILETAKFLKENSKEILPYFIFVGADLTSPYAQKLKNYIVKENLIENCFILGEKDKNFIFNLLPNMTGMIISSNSEGLPLTISEALKCKVPIISTNVGGIGDIIKDGQNGLLIDSDKISLYEKIIKISNDSILREQLKNNGYKTYMEKLDLEKNLYEVNKIVDKLISG